MTLFKNLLLSAGLLFVTGTALSAQELGKLHYRAEAGLAISRMSGFGVHHQGDEGKYLPSLRIGGSLVMPFDNTIFAFTPGLYLSGRGEKQGSLSNGQKSLSAVQTYTCTKGARQQKPVSCSVMRIWVPLSKSDRV